MTPASNGNSGFDTGTEKLTYNPNANFNGFDSFTYTAFDGTAYSNAAGVDVTVNAVNDAPDAVNDTRTFAEDSGMNAGRPLANDTDVDGDTLIVTAL